MARRSLNRLQKQGSAMADDRARHLRRGVFTAVSALVLALLASAPAALAASQPAADSHATQGTSGTSGSTDQHQPLSTADQNSGGANGQCPSGAYCSTRDGSASANGKGDGKATGKPCAGCVGKADNKNPQGQKPNGTDANAGYECDRNQGIGQSNPAHTSCTTPTTSGGGGSDCTTNPTAPGCPGVTPTSGGGGSACVPTEANGFCSSVLGEHVSAPPSAQVLSATETQTPTTPTTTTTSTLPMTGRNLVPLAVAGIGAVGAGALLLMASVRRRERLS